MFEKCDAYLFLKTEKVSEQSVRYFTGIKSDFAMLLKFKRRQILYLTALEEKPKVNYPVRHFDFYDVAKELKKGKVKRLGVHYGELSKQSFDRLKKICKGVKFVNIGKEINDVRAIKRAEEVKHLKKAIALTEEILWLAVSKLKKCTYEAEVVSFIRQEYLKRGVQESFPPIVASGSHSKNPHYEPKSTAKIQKGFCIIDMGVKWKGYCADITRTVYIGKPTSAERAFYNKILSQLKKFEKTIKPGMKRFEADFDMIHMIGHGIGLDVHEDPGVGVHELKVGNCLAIEPAQYTKKYGVRIEDDYYLSKTGLKRLSKSKQELITL